MGNSRGSSDPRAAASARLRRLIPIGVGVVIILIVVLIATAPRSGRGVDAKASTPEAIPTATTTSTETVAADPSEPAKPTAAKPAPTIETATKPVATATINSGDRLLEGLHVVIQEVDQLAPPLPMLGGLTDLSAANMQVQLTRQGAGIVEIPFANIWTNVRARRQAAAWFAAQGTSTADDVSLPPDDERFILATAPQAT